MRHRLRGNVSPFAPVPAQLRDSAQKARRRAVATHAPERRTPNCIQAPDLRVFRIHPGLVDGIPGMRINRKLKGSEALSEHRVSIPVEILAVGLTIDHGSLKPEVMDAALKLVGSLRRVLHGQMSKPTITRGGAFMFPSREDHWPISTASHRRPCLVPPGRRGSQRTEPERQSHGHP